MTAEPTTDEGPLTVAPPGTEVDLLTCPGWRGELLSALERADCRVLIVDLSRVVFFGASGLGVLVDVRDRSAQCGVELRLIVCSRPVWRALEVTGLAGSFAVYSSRADAQPGRSSVPARRAHGSAVSCLPPLSVHRE